MTMRRTIFALFATLAMVLVGCEVEDAALNNEKTYTLDEVPTVVIASGGVDVLVDSSLAHDQILATTNARNFNNLTIDVSDGVLNMDVNEIFSNNKYRVYVPACSYKLLKAKGGSDILWSNCSVDNLSIEASGGSDCEIVGSVTTLSIIASGGSEVECGELQAEDVTIDASGGSDVSACASKTLSLTAFGGSDIHITGNPQILLWLLSGGSDVDFN